MYEYKIWYPVFLKSEEWKATSGEVRKRAKGRCERCGEWCGKGHVHHPSYDLPSKPGSRWPRGWDTFPEYLQFLCPNCHEFLHKRATIDPANITFEALEAAIKALKY